MTVEQAIANTRASAVRIDPMIFEQEINRAAQSPRDDQRDAAAVVRKYFAGGDINAWQLNFALREIHPPLAFGLDWNVLQAA